RSSVRAVMRTACPASTISLASRRPRQPPATIRIRATAAMLGLDYAARDERGHDERGRGDDGQGRGAVQEARVRVPLLGDLRRRGLDLRLRALRGAAEGQREERV